MKRKYNFNDDFFEKIDNEQKAYFLGLLLADGNVYALRNRIQITLIKSDQYILEEFAKVIGYTGKIYLDREKYSKLILPSKKMCEDLFKLGCYPRKGSTLNGNPANLPKINKTLINHLIRGYFDGDGHISKNKKLTNPYYNINITGSLPLITKMKKILIKNNITVSKIYKYKKKISCTIVILNKSSKNFITYLYKDANYYLTRKKNIYEYK